MATLPRSVASVDPTAIAPGGGTKLICILSPVATQADITPRIYGNAKAIYDVHGYSEGVEYAALHITQTALPVLFIGLPIGTPGALSRKDSSGNTGSSVVTSAAGSAGVLGEHDGVLRVVSGGTIGTDQIHLSLSLDGGRSFKNVRLGTANSYVVSDVNVTLSFAAGTLVTGDTVHTWHGSAPIAASADLITARTALAGTLHQIRSMLLCGDCPSSTLAAAFNTQLEAYATANDRFVFGRASVYDRLPVAAMSKEYAVMTGSPALTFATAGDTITRSGGSWLTDGFRVGDTFTISGTASNDGTYTISTVDALEIATVENLADESFSGVATVTGGPTLTFTASGNTIVRNRGSWLTDGFRIGDPITIAGSASNDGELTPTNVTATTLTFASGVVNETILASTATLTTGETKAEHVARADADFASVDDDELIDLSIGRGSIQSQWNGYFFRRPAGWAASLREYQHDVHVATWRKDLGSTGFNLFDANNELVEYDDRVDGGAASAARFTSFRTWANGPRGAFISLSLTRKGDGQIQSLTHNQAVVNVALSTVQTAGEQVIGRSLALNDDGTATTESLAVIASEVNAALELALLANLEGEGPRASKAVWTPSPDDIYNVPEPTMNGVLELVLNGTVHSVNTLIRIRANGQ